MEDELTETIILIVTEVRARGEIRALNVKGELQYYHQWISTCLQDASEKGEIM
jgi:hypothetical protein